LFAYLESGRELLVFHVFERRGQIFSRKSAEPFATSIPRSTYGFGQDRSEIRLGGGHDVGRLVLDRDKSRIRSSSG